eukprot:TRINITY_DN63611_c0_g1_i1.p1 TRINITY_DN63611_c0_g1~~TRINITY_DN63611_c0_g1_i1.p1  ORF type:complete len:590 (-),score=90.30 TRINITY_DN63611_c0_g1_i1:285-2054(-)
MACFLAAWVTLSVLPIVVVGSSPSFSDARNGWMRSAIQGQDLVVRPMFMLRHVPGTLARLDAFVAEVSTPGRPRYGAYLDMAGLKKQFPVADGAEEAVRTFLASHGIKDEQVSVSASGDMVQAEIPIATARSMFRAEFHQYEHPQTSRRIVRAMGGYMTPSHIDAHVYLVGNLNEFPDVRRLKQVTAPEENTNFGADCGWVCTSRVTPGVLASRYGFNASDVAVSSSKDTGMATAEFQGVYYDTASLDHFQSDCSMKQKIRVDHQVGANFQWHCLSGSACIEALLDIEYAKSVSGGINLTNIFNSEYSLLNWAKQVDDLGDAGPSVHSISYGNDEIQQDEVAPSNMTGKAYMEATNVQFAKLAARGISVMVASGDQGVCGRSGCARRFHPDFPASSPYVTAVGGTDFATKNVIGEEEAWSSGGGGFSDEFSRPAWQQTAVDNYLAEASKAGKLPQETAFNRKGRAYPDVAALGGERNPYCIAAKMFPGFEKMQGVAGTSASCPVFAGLVARLNAARLAKGMPRMGLMNPWIYQHPEVFHDVTKGVNDGGGDQGFAAMAGWDPATGMGTPNFGSMLSAALKQSTSESIVV